MAIICRDLKLLYIMVGGTACSSTGKLLREKFGGKWLPEENLPGLHRKHNSIKQLVKHKVISQPELNSYLKVANVRNPFDSIVTEYVRLIDPNNLSKFLEQPNSWIFRNKNYPDILKREIEFARNAGFERWILKKFGWQSRGKGWLKHFLGRNSCAPGQQYRLFTEGVDEFIYFEKLQQDLNNVLRKVGVSDWVTLPNINPTIGKQDYKKYYTPKSRQVVEKVFSWQLAKFGYFYDYQN